MSITAAYIYEKEGLPPVIDDNPLQDRFDGAVDWDPHSKFLMSPDKISETQAASANDGDSVETFEFLPPFDQSTNFNELLRQIDAMRWSDPIGAANRLLQIDTEHLPFKHYEDYKSLAQELSNQLKHVEGSIAQITLWDLDRASDSVDGLSLLFASDSDDEVMSLFANSTMESLSDDINNALRAVGDDENGLPKNAGIVTQMATLAYALHENQRLDSLPTGQYNPEAAIEDERTRMPAYIPGMAA